MSGTFPAAAVTLGLVALACIALAPPRPLSHVAITPAVRARVFTHGRPAPVRSASVMTLKALEEPLPARWSPSSDHEPTPVTAPTALLALAAAVPAAALLALGLLRPRPQRPPLAMCSFGSTPSPRKETRLGHHARADTPTENPAPVALISEEGKRQLLEKTDVFVFDCDGVIWRGEVLIEGVKETLAMLRARGKQLFFVTNNSTKSRAGYLKKFQSLGLDVKAEEIYSSSYAAAAYLESIQFPKDVPIYIIGEVGIEEELELCGFTYTGGPKDVNKTIELKLGFALPHDSNVQAVIVGFDRYINYYKIQYAQLCINENPGCMFLATNLDQVTHLTDAQEWAGNGSMVGCIRGCTGKEPIVVGKPSGFMMENIAAKLGVDKSRICMVGDRLDTDILFGQNNGTGDLLVLSGVTSEADVLRLADKYHPSAIIPSIAGFLTLQA